MIFHTCRPILSNIIKHSMSENHSLLLYRGESDGIFRVLVGYSSRGEQGTAPYEQAIGSDINFATSDVTVAHILFSELEVSLRLLPDEPRISQVDKAAMGVADKYGGIDVIRECNVDEYFRLKRNRENADKAHRVPELHGAAS